MPSRRLLSTSLEEVRVPLTDSEWRERAERIGRVGARIEELDIKLEALKDETKDLKEERESSQAEAVKLARAIREHAEVRRMEVEDFADYDLDEVVTSCKATGERLRHRPLTDDERQTVLPLKAAITRLANAVPGAEVSVGIDGSTVKLPKD